MKFPVCWSKCEFTINVHVANSTFRIVGSAEITHSSQRGRREGTKCGDDGVKVMV